MHTHHNQDQNNLNLGLHERDKEDCKLLLRCMTIYIAVLIVYYVGNASISTIIQITVALFLGLALLRACILDAMDN
jgi:hypothetical protein